MNHRFTLLRTTLLIFGLLALVLGSIAPSSVVPIAQAAGTISGTVYRDINSNSVKDASEPGVTGVTITAYDASGANVGTASTATNGTYSLSASGMGPYRVEFTGWPSYLQPGPKGSQNSTSVQFVPDGTTSNVNLGIHDPNDYSQTNPNLAIVRFMNGDPLVNPTTAGNAGAVPSILGFPYNATSATTPTTLALESAAGATWGLAWKRDTRQLFTSAFVKRHTGLGSAGLGGIYVINNPTTSPTAATFVDLESAPFNLNFGSLGSNTARGLAPGVTSASSDPTAWDAVGRQGMGDIDISDDGNTLWVVNLYSSGAVNAAGALVRMDVTGGSTPANAQSFALNTLPGMPTCTGGVLRPFGLKLKSGAGYLGAVCTAETSKNRNDLHAYVLSFDPNNVAAGVNIAVDIPMTYTRGSAWDNTSLGVGLGGQTGQAHSDKWYPWVGSWNATGNATVTEMNGIRINSPTNLPDRYIVAHPTPLLSDIEFDASGAMIIGFLDRTPAQMGGPNSDPSSSSIQLEAITGGEVLRACPLPAGWTLETNGACGGVTSAGANNGDGPGGGEFYSGEKFGGAGDHLETSQGGLAQVAGLSDIVLSAMDPTDYDSGGAIWLDNTTGNLSRGYNIYTLQKRTTDGNWSKGSSMGDIEVLSDPAPIEIGNRVWNDTDNDGIQDPGEAPIANVTIELYQGGVKVGQATTNSSGEYYFGGTSNQNMLTTPSPRTVTAQIAASSDDAEQSTSVIVNSTILDLPYSPATAQLVGLRFNGIAIPQGATITNAYLQFTAQTADSATPINMTIRGQAMDNPPTFTTSANNISSRTTTSASVNWSNIGSWTAGVAGAAQQTPSLATIAQEIVNRSGWASGNSMAFIVSDNGSTANQRRRAVSFDGGAASAPQLVIEYTEPEAIRLQLHTAYEVRVPNATGGSQQSVLSGLTLTTANAAQPANGNATATDNSPATDVADSDGSLSGVNAVINYTTGGPGANNHGLDFGFTQIQTYSLGNRVWYDTNNDGLDNDGASGALGTGVSGATVQLLDNGGAVVAITTTDANGYYRFDTLLAGTYTVALPASNFAAGGRLESYQNSTLTFADNVDANDNGTVSGTLGSGGDVHSAPITLGLNLQPTGEAGIGGGTNGPSGDANDNLSVDFGFYRLTLGNRVWYDNNRNGADDSEAGVSGVTVTLLDSVGSPIATSTTDSTGYYTFTNVLSGTYSVQIQAVANYVSSSPDDMTNNTDLNDNGQGASGGVISSQPFNLTPGVASGAITVNSPTGTTRNRTIDFGIYQPVADLQALKNVTPPIYTEGVATPVQFTVVITNYGPSPVVNAPVTDTQPTNVTFDSWTCAIQDAGSGSGTNACDTASGTGDINTIVSLRAGASARFTINATISTAATGTIVNTASETLPVGMAQDTVNRPDSASVSVLPMQPLFSVGNRIWFDTNDDGATSGPGTAEPVPTLLMQLVYSGTTTIVQTTLTGANGYYRFDNVPAGDYQVVVAASNFQDGGILEGYHNSSFYTSTTTLAGDNRDHAPNPLSNPPVTGVRSVGFSLGIGLQPTGETASGGGEDGPHGDANSNLTIDFGFNLQHTGNQLWFDTDNNGVYDSGELPVPAGVVVVLHAVVFGIDAGPVLTTTTDLNGQYNFDASGNSDLDPTGVFLYVAIPPGQAALNSYVPSSVRDESGGADNHNTGVMGATGVITSGLFYPLPASMANGAVVFDDLGETYQSTIDFGFVLETYSVGNRVWFDTDNDGQFDASEQPAVGVVMQLLDSHGDLVGTMSTTVDGYYRFDNLLAGGYTVVVAANNFTTGGSLYGYQSSVGATASSANPGDDNKDHGIDIAQPGVDGVRSGVVMVGSHLQPTSESDGANGPGGDATDNLTIDFGFYQLSLGDVVWYDIDNDGLYEPATESGISNVPVRLFASDGVTEISIGPDGVLGTSDDAPGGVVTNSSGQYLFRGLAPGDYIVKVTPPTGYASSTGINGSSSGPYELAPDPDTNLNDDDNGANGAGADTGHVVSPLVTLTAGSLGAANNNTVINVVGSTSDPTVDFGLFQPLSLGNLVWHDLNNDGLMNSGEPRIDGVVVNLYYDANNDGDVSDAGETTPLLTTVTAGGGLYLFNNLAAGAYVVELAASNFTGSGVLVGYTSSTGANGDITGPYEMAPDPDNSGVDNDDNGSFSDGVIRSSVLTLSASDEPTGENPDNDASTPDNNANLTVDFGVFQPFSLGNRVWYDTNSSGLIDGDETGIDGVTVRLYTSNGATLAATTTANGGYYRFDNLIPDDYIVAVDTASAPIAGLVSSSVDAGDPDADTDDSDDNGVTMVGTEVHSAPVTIGPANPPARMILFDGQGAADERANMTVDFGFVGYDRGDLPDTGSGTASGNYATLNSDGGPSHQIVPDLYMGASVDGELDGQPDSGATGDNTTGTPDDEDGVTVADLTLTETLNASVRVNATNTTGTAATLYGFLDFNGDGDFADTGETASVSVPVDSNNAQFTLNFGSVPLGSAASTYARFRLSTDAAAANPTGVATDGEVEDYPVTITPAVVSLGNQVWYDTNNNGVVDADEAGVDSVRVELFLDANANGAVDAAEQTPVAVQVTSSGGYYLFTQTTSSSGVGTGTALTPAQYIVGIAPSNFATGGVLINSRSSGTTIDSAGAISDAPIVTNGTTDSNADNADDGASQSSGFYSGGVLSDPLVVSVGSEPTSEPTFGQTAGDTPGHSNAVDGTASGMIIPDANSNLTIDFGFYRQTLGNLVFHDANNNGTADVGEVPIAGATVKLFAQDGITELLVGPDGILGTSDDAAGGVTTDAGGTYLFQNLPEGEYVVQVMPPAGYTSSTDGASSADPDNNTDSDDNGIGATTSAATSAAIMLTPGSTGASYPNNVLTAASGTTANPTVDFGFYTLSLGNLVWNDTNNNGLRDGIETGIDAVTVNLYRDTDSSGTLNAGDTLVSSQPTSNGGHYLFSGLAPAPYLVQLDPANFQSGGALVGYASSTGTDGAVSGPYEPGTNDVTDSDDNGTIGTGGLATDGIVSGPITLTAGTQPTSETDTALPTGITDTAVDSSSNLTIDFGVFQPASLGDFLWNDLNQNGVQDVGESGLNGVTVSLYDSTGTTLIDTQVTATNGGVDGYYHFANLVPNTAYVIKLDNPADFTGSGPLANTQLSPTDVGTDDTIDSDAVLVTGVPTIASATTGGPGSDTPTYDIGIYRPTAALGDFVWNDANKNGVQDVGETGINGVTVNLYDSTGTILLATTTTATNGSMTGDYHFANLVPNTTYMVKLDNAADYAAGGVLTNFMLTAANQGGDDTTDSDAIVSGGYPAITTAATGADGSDTRTYDFGGYQPLSLGNLVWNDTNNNGLKDGIETGIDSVAVNLYQDTDTSGTFTAGDTLVMSQTTSNGGHYLFTDLGQATYFVQIDATNFATGGMLFGYTSSTGATFGTIGAYEPGATTPDDNNDNGTANAGAIISDPIMLVANTQPTSETDTALPIGITDTALDVNSNLTIDFGVFQPASLGDYVWNDANKNGVQDAGETGIDGVTVSLYTPNGKDGVGGNADDNLPVATTTTATNGSSGYYHFASLNPNTPYMIALDNPTDFATGGLLAGTILTDLNQGGDDTKDSDATLVGGYPTISATTGTPGSDTPTYDFGLLQPLSLGNLVWNDLNNNGLKDVGEPGIDSVTVNLYQDTDNSGTLTAGDAFVSSQLTSNGGHYLFTNLGQGNYLVQLDPTSFQSGGTLEGYGSSTGTNGALSGPYEPVTVVGVTDDDDNGTTGAGGPATSGIVSGPITLTIGAQPTGETDTTLPTGITDTAADNSSNLTIDFGVFQSASLGDFIWNDVNQNGVQDGGEVGINGVTVNLYDATGTTLISNMLTTGNGAYHFANLTPNTAYVIKLDNATNFATGGPLAGYTISPNDVGTDNTTDSDAVLVGATPTIASATTGGPGSDTPTYDIGFSTRASLGDFIWNDTNKDGIQDAGETGINGVTVNLYDATGTTLVSSTLTAGNGAYHFINLTINTAYVIKLDNPADFMGSGPLANTQFSPTDAGTDDTIDSDAALVSNVPTIAATTGGPASDTPTYDIGIYRPAAALGDFVWKDANQNGVQDASEVGINGVTVNLYDSTGATLISSTLTAGNGGYHFVNLTINTAYTVKLDNPADYAAGGSLDGFVPTPADQGVDDSTDSDATSVNGYPTIPAVTGGDGSDTSTYDSGVYQPLSLGNLVWNDLNNNGVQDGGETGIDNATINLYQDTNGSGTLDAGDTLITSQPTSNGGHYLFSDLVPATYLVQLDPSNFQAGGALVGYGSSTGTNGAVSGPYEPGTNNATDNDDNGTTGTGGLATAGVTGGIASGPITLAAGTQPTNETDLGMPTGVTDSASNANSNLTIDFGVFQPARLGDYVWFDANRNGVQDAVEVGMNGVLVSLYTPDGADGIAGNADDSLPIATMTTTTNGGVNGFYHFDSLTPNTTYTIALDRASDFVAGGPLAGYTLTGQDAGGNDTTDSDAALVVGVPTISALSGAPGSNTLTYDFGFNTSASLGDYIWLDSNNDGIQDAMETGINGVTVNLYDSTGTTLIATTTTATQGGVDGYYHFTNLDINTTYVIKLDNLADFTGSGPLANTRLSPMDAGGDDAKDSDATLISGTPTISITTGGPGSDTPTYDIGVYRPSASLGDYVWNDANKNGVQDAGEIGINGVTVNLYDSTGTTLIATTTTATNGSTTGFYHFANLIPNTAYVVKLDNPADYAAGGALANFTLTPANQGGNDATDSDATVVGGYPTIATATTGGDGSDTPTYDIGVYQPLSLGNLVWNDRNNNGLKDASESAINEVAVNLYQDTNGNSTLDAGDTLVSSQTTSNDGHYLFTNLGSATYFVELAASNFTAGGPLAGYRSSTGIGGAATGPYEPGAIGSVDNDDNGTNTSSGIVSGPIALAAGTQPTNEIDTGLPTGVNNNALDSNSNLTVDFGVFQPASLGSIVWNDTNQDGMYQPDEPGVAGVTATLYDSTGTPVAITTTDANGGYTFSNLVPGTYTVGFTTLPPGSTFTTPNQGGNDSADSDVDAATGRTGSITIQPGENNLTIYAGIVTAPTAITLTHFGAAWQGSSVVVQWTTSSEIGTFGFHLLRSSDGTRAHATRVTPTLITAQGRGQGGAAYTWTDTTVAGGQTYTYWLEETEVDGATHVYGPTTANAPGPVGTHRVLLPLVRR